MIKIESGIVDLENNKCGMKITSIKRECGLILEGESLCFLSTFNLSKDAIKQLIEFLQKEIE
jgi:TusA-related sulfurtransferase